MFGLQGSNVGILGAGQTWFITSIIICYLCTPLIRKIANNEYANVIMAMLYVIFPCILSLFKPAWPSTLLCPITSYSIAYLIGKNINKIDFKMNYAFIAILILGTAFGIRFISRIMFDGTFLYERVIVQYTSSIGAFCICYIISTLFKDKKVSKCLKKLSSVSFEVYLFHYMFIVGPVSLYRGTTQFMWLVSSILVLLVTVIISTIVHMLSEKVLVLLK